MSYLQTDISDIDGFPISWDEKETETGMSAIRVLRGVFEMDGVDHTLYTIAVKIQS